MKFSKSNKIITLTTDFGFEDPFPGSMKGVILTICPTAQIVDITHNISPQDIKQGNFVLKACHHFFPKGTIHVCVIDPGVGSERRPILVKTKDYYFIGPDNGLFTFVNEDEKIISITELTEKKYWLKNVSHTFHGRDIFAPVAAHLAKGINPASFGENLKKDHLTIFNIKKFTKDKNSFHGVVQFIDHFGNIVTNIPNKEIPPHITGKIKTYRFKGLVRNFAEAKQRTLTAIRGSSNFIELFIYKGNAAKLVKAEIGDEVDVKYSKD